MKQTLLLILLILPASSLLAHNNSISARLTPLPHDTAPGVLGYNEQGIPGLFVNKSAGKPEFKRLDGAEAATLLTPKQAAKLPATGGKPAYTVVNKAVVAPSAAKSQPGKTNRDDSTRHPPPLLAY